MEILDVLLDALLDSLKVLGVAFILYFILSFIEDKLTNLMTHHKKTSPIIGASVGLIPQCGFSVVAADLYLKEHISMGCLVAVFFACSDEALPIMLSDYSKVLYLIPLLLIKFIMGFVIGYTVDLFLRKKEYHAAELEANHIGCCHHEIDHDESKIHEHLIHPLIHSLKIFAYVLVVNVIFGLIVFWIGEDNILSFLQTNNALSPFVCAIVGLIPNCASSVLLTELFLLDGIPFGALVAGLAVNAGLGLVYLLKNRKRWKDVLIIIAILFTSAIIVGYITFGFELLFK